ncbi:hypothetical protein [Streptomyces luteireticuli]|uniref:hypothetical protein n=1 Tax=Streptomyces luteireticuli TaxID=173858 RepID=UPI0035566598
MFTGTAAELADRERQARAIAEQIAALLTKAGQLGLGPAFGSITIPGAGEIRPTGDEWTLR